MTIARHARTLVRRQLLAVVLVSGVAAAPAVRLDAQRAVAAGTSPLSTSDFASLVQQLSDSGGYFDTDNLISNERSYLHALTYFDRIGVRGGAYIGVGPDQNFSYIARVRPEIVFIVDIRRDNQLHHLLLKALFALSQNRAEFLARWTGRPVPANVDAYGTRDIDALVNLIDASQPTAASQHSALSAVTAEVQRYGLHLTAADLATIARFHQAFLDSGLSLRFTSTGRAPQSHYPTLRQLLQERDLNGQQSSYLASEVDFRFLKSLQRRNLVIPLVGDLASPRTLPAIGAELRARGLSVSVLYTSNVEDYLLRDGRFPAYAAVVRRLPRTERSVLVRSLFGGPMSHSQSVPGYYSTQLLQSLAAFSTEPDLAAVRSYRELAQRWFIPR